MNSPTYREIVERLRPAFPPPVSDNVHDGYVVFSMLRALDRVDALKSEAPILGSPREPDFSAALQARLDDGPKTTEAVIGELVRCLEGMPIWGHPRSQVNVIPPSSIASVIGVVLPSIFNPNLCSEESGHGFSEAEVRASAMTADLVGFDPARAGGLFTFGGSGTLLYGLKIALEKAVPGCLEQGLGGAKVCVLASDQSHYACQTAAGWLGIGRSAVRKAATTSDNAVRIDELERLARQALQAGERVAAIVATMGTTDAMGIDDLAAVVVLRDRLALEFKLDYRPHVHADAVIGWAWSVFSDYDFTVNPLDFRGRTVRALASITSRIRRLGLADSLGVDFHKTGFCPYISSLLLVREREEFRFITRDRSSMPYLFHTGDYHPGQYTLETTRSGGGPMAALANLLLLGRDGLRALLGHAVEMAEILREQIGATPELTVVNRENAGPVTLFRAYPKGVDTFAVTGREMNDASFRDQLLAYNDFNRRVFQRVHREALSGRGVALGFTECYRRSSYGDPVVALKSYVLSPFAAEDRMHEIIDHVQAARAEVERETQAAG